jgi:hypothetical protein
MDQSEDIKATHASQIVGNVSLYSIHYQLSCRGWKVMPTARKVFCLEKRPEWPLLMPVAPLLLITYDNRIRTLLLCD